MQPCVVCKSPPVKDVGQVRVKLSLNTRDYSHHSAPFVYLDYFPMKTHRSAFGWRNLGDELKENQRYVDEDGDQISPGDVPVSSTR